MEQRFSNHLAQETRRPFSAILLITFRDDAEKIIASMDSVNSEYRMIVLEAIEILIGKYISPLMEEYERFDKFVDPFDLDNIAGAEIRGLVGGQLEEKLKEQMNGLEKPHDRILKEALEYVDVPIDEIERRDIFFNSWAGIKASSTISSLIDFLGKPLANPNPPKIESATVEQAKIKELLKKNLTGSIRYSLERLEERLNRGK